MEVYTEIKLTFSMQVKPSGLPPQHLDNLKFYLFIVVLFCNCFWNSVA